MDHNLIGLAFAAGMVAALNPCGFAMLPGYLMLVVQSEGGRRSAVLRALGATAAMALGFLTVFGLFGLLTVSVASTVQQHAPYATVLVGIALVALGIWLLSGREITAFSWRPSGPRWAPTAQIGSMFGYGVAYAVASLSCTVGPFLAVTGSSMSSGSLATGVAVYAAYAAGLALVVGALAVTVAVASTALVERLRRILPYINRIGGAMLVVVGAYVAYYGWFELRLFADGRSADPVIAAAGRVQRSLAGWVYQHGAWPWLGILAVAGLLTAGAIRRRRYRRDESG